MHITCRSEASASGTLMSFNNPLSVENHDFDIGMELGSYIVYWSTINIMSSMFLPWNSATPKILSITDCLRLCFRMDHHCPAWFIISKFFPYLLIIKTSTRKKVCCQLKIEKNSCSIFSSPKRVFNGLAHHRISHSPLLFHFWQRHHAYYCRNFGVFFDLRWRIPLR